MSSKLKKASSKFLRGSELDYMENSNITSIRKNTKRKPQNNIGQLNLKEIHPMTHNQDRVFSAYKEGKNVICSGFAGCGKTFLAMYLALNEIFYEDNGYEKIIIIRSLVKSREIGHLPGSVDEKGAPFEAPYQAICNELFGRGDAYEILKKKDVIQFENTSFLRGITFNNCIIIVEEVENFSFHECDTVISRYGHNCRMIFTGDMAQTDLLYTKEKSGFDTFMRIASIMDSFDIVEFEIDDVVRSGVVKEYLIAKSRVESGYS